MIFTRSRKYIRENENYIGGIAMLTVEKEQVSILDIINVLEIKPKAIEFINQMEFLLETDNECASFLNEAIGKTEQEMYKILMRIRKDKIRNKDMRFSDFKRHYDVNAIEAIEQLLQEPITEAKYSKFKGSNIAPERFYLIHKQNPFARLMNVLILV